MSRWLAVIIIALSSAINYLDRQVLAALGPDIRTEFGLSAAQFGLIVSAFSLPYAISAPLAGVLLDRIGLRIGSSLAVASWSLISIATAFTTGLSGLYACRSVLGVAEAAGIPSTGKASAVYLLPSERALGSAVSQMGLTVGVVAAPLLAAWLSVQYGWRSTFLVTGLAGLLWIPLWLWVSRRSPAAPQTAHEAQVPLREILRDPPFWGMMLANILMMTIYSLWSNWTTIFLVGTHGLNAATANRQLAWIPPVFATLGGLAGGFLAARWTQAMPVVKARLRCILLGCAMCLVTAAVPLAPGAGLATAFICASYFSCVLASVNLYSLPIDLYGSRRAAFTVSTLTASFGVLQAVYSPAVGAAVDRFSFTPVCYFSSLLPLASFLVVWLTARGRRSASDVTA